MKNRKPKTFTSFEQMKEINDLLYKPIENKPAPGIAEMIRLVYEHKEMLTEGDAMHAALLSSRLNRWGEDAIGGFVGRAEFEELKKMYAKVNA